MVTLSRYSRQQLRYLVDPKEAPDEPATGKSTIEEAPDTAIADCTRIRVLRIYNSNTQKTAIQFIDDALSRVPFRTEVIRTDNGSEFQGQFHWHVLDKGINHHNYHRPQSALAGMTPYERFREKAGLQV